MAENRELALVLKLVADQFNSELKKSQGLLGGFNSFIKDWKTQLVAAGGALFAIAKSTANYGEALLKTSQKIGINVEAMAGLQHAANLADLSHEQLAQGLKFLSVNMVEAARQTGDGEALFRRLGVSATDATGQLRPTEAVLLDLADTFAKSKDGAGKAEVAVKLFGRAGLDLIPFLNQGKAGITALMDEARQLGLVMSQEDAEAATRFNDELKKLQGTMRGLVLDAGKPMLGVLTELGEALRSLTTNDAAKFFFRGLAEHALLFSTFVKEAAANVQFLFGKLTMDQLRAEIDKIEAEGRRKRFELRHPGVLTPSKAGGGAAQEGRQEIAVLADQVKLGKAKLEIFLEQNRALEIRQALQQEEDDRIALADEFDAEIEEEKGRLIVERTALQVKIRDEARHDEQQGLIENAQAWVAYYDQLGGNAQDFLSHKTELLRAQLAKELDLTRDQSAELLAAWRDRDSQRAEQILSFSAKSGAQKETIELNTLRQDLLNTRAASDDFFSGWAEGMRKYVADTQSGFGLAADMARRTAQAMEQSFRNFFFDVMDNKIKSLKDVFVSLLGFVKQIIAQITAQLITSQILRFFTAGVNPSTTAQNFSSTNFFAPATGGTVVKRFALGGPVPGFGTRDTVPALLTPGEVVLSRTDVQDIKRGAAGGSPVSIAITVNAMGGERRESSTGAQPNFSQLARDLSRLVEVKIIEEQRPGGLLAGA